VVAIETLNILHQWTSGLIPQLFNINLKLISTKRLHLTKGQLPYWVCQNWNDLLIPSPPPSPSPPKKKKQKNWSWMKFRNQDFFLLLDESNYFWITGHIPYSEVCFFDTLTKQNKRFYYYLVNSVIFPKDVNKNKTTDLSCFVPLIWWSTLWQNGISFAWAAEIFLKKWRIGMLHQQA